MHRAKSRQHFAKNYDEESYYMEMYKTQAHVTDLI